MRHLLMSGAVLLIGCVCGCSHPTYRERADQVIVTTDLQAVARCERTGKVIPTTIDRREDDYFHLRAETLEQHGNTLFLTSSIAPDGVAYFCDPQLPKDASLTKLRTD